jgi:serine/threonine protein kinase
MASPEPRSAGVRFRKLREYASGNLGVVYVARDEELNREVALKEIKEKTADHLHSQAKFLLEAEVTGGLEHPGIVPVYGLGHYGRSHRNLWPDAVYNLGLYAMPPNQLMARPLEIGHEEA